MSIEINSSSASLPAAPDGATETLLSAGPGERAEFLLAMMAACAHSEISRGLADWIDAEIQSRLYRNALEEIANGPRDADLSYLELFQEDCRIARRALGPAESGLGQPSKASAGNLARDEQ